MISNLNVMSLQRGDIIHYKIADIETYDYVGVFLERFTYTERWKLGEKGSVFHQLTLYSFDVCHTITLTFYMRDTLEIVKKAK